MKVVILAGGAQSTINNEYEGIPKPMIDIGGRPLLWHIMKHFSQYGMNEFIICGGYRVDMIKEYFMDYYIYASDITVDLQTNTIQIHKKVTEDWKVTVVDTGLMTTPAQRISMIEKYIGDKTFVVTYGDCLSDVDMAEVCAMHKDNSKLATVVLAKPTGRNQLLPMGTDGKMILEDKRNIQDDYAWINADCFVFEKGIFEYLKDGIELEKMLPVKLVQKNEITFYKHSGFWNAIETRRDLANVEKLWNERIAPWFKRM